MRQSKNKFNAIQQPELFENHHKQPRWSDFSLEVQEAVTTLVARLLQQHRHLEMANAEPKEVEHE